MCPNRTNRTLLATGAWVVLMSAGVLHPSLQAQTAPRDTMLSACVHVVNGSMRLTLPNEACKREERSSPGGVRTFPMLALSGAMLYLIEPRQALAFVVGLIALAIWLHAFLRHALTGPTATSLMVPASNLVAYLIGPVALAQPPWLVVAVSVTAVLLLGTREELHKLIWVVPKDELLTVGKFLILVGIILPLVPNEPVTAATPLTPYQVWLAVVAICTLHVASASAQANLALRGIGLAK
jgi:hypothetical protein